MLPSNRENHPLDKGFGTCLDTDTLIRHSDITVLKHYWAAEAQCSASGMKETDFKTRWCSYSGGLVKASEDHRGVLQHISALYIWQMDI